MRDSSMFGTGAARRAEWLAVASSVVALFGAAPAAGAEGGDASAVLSALAASDAMTPADAAQAASAIAAGRAVREVTDPAERALLAGAALERAGDLDGARKAYEDVRGRACVPCAASAGLASDLLAARPKGRAAVEAVYDAAARQPDAAGWFKIDGKWSASTRRVATASALVELRGKSVSFLFFDAIRARSPLPPEYAYVFVLLVIAVAMRLVALPLHWQQVRTNVVLARIQPQVAAIQARQGDPVAWAELKELYVRNGVQFRGPLLLALLNFGFVFLLYFTISAYAPRFVLDGSRLFSVSDVTRPTFWITLLAVVASVVVGRLSNPHAARGRARLAQDFSGGILMLLVAWIFSFPVYVMVFLVLLQAVSGVLERILYVIRKMSGGIEALPA